jgi:nitroreductase
MSTIFERKSIRRYTGEKVSEEKLELLLKAAMAAPSAGNQQPWEFIVLRDRSIFKRIMEFHPYSQPLREADVAIVVCGNEPRERFRGYWVQDCSAATENILLQAEEMGLGAVWMGVYPMEDRVRALKELLQVPEFVTPLNIVSIGYPAENRDAADRFDKSRIHYDRW